MTLRNAAPNEASALFSLYESVKGEPFCVWNENYPGLEEINMDLETQNVYVLTENGKIIGAVSVETKNDMDTFECWECNDGTQAEIARVVISKEFRGKGLAKTMTDMISSILKNKGCNSIHLAAAKVNIPAFKTYTKAGFSTVGEAFIYGHDYYLMEKMLVDLCDADGDFSDRAHIKELVEYAKS